MKKILLTANIEKAEALILELEKHYLQAIRTVIVGVNSLGITEVPKKFVIELINGNSEQLGLKYWEIANKDLEPLKSPAARKQMQDTAEKMLSDFIWSIPGLFMKTVEDGSSRRLDDKYFQNLFDIDEAGKPFIPDEAKEFISESFREYLTNPKFVKVYETQHQLAESIQAFADSLVAAKLDKNGFLLARPWQFLTNCFEIEATKDEESGAVTESIKIIPRQLNYNKE